MFIVSILRNSKGRDRPHLRSEGLFDAYKGLPSCRLFLGVGSNANPRENIPRALAALVRRFGCLHSSSIYLTEPVAVDGDELFRNLVLFLPTTLAEAELKAFCNDIETQLGRDRTHPQRKWIARPVDLDILRCFAGETEILQPEALAQEPYFLVAIPELLRCLGLAPATVTGSPCPTEAVVLDGVMIGKQPFSLHCPNGQDVEVCQGIKPQTLSDIKEPSSV
ncbi:2-amino-4-hydroxy-6-hydroxymethyldihydropteridine diphosphokinase [Alkalilimnicola ehrlichii]|uniref:2-amino-4-hydroxy-6- hydroxymethyldihydropteridine diphosphokinase n=1 Tax=Alkalilimnicola ehrlichii TaxID=351052 RepID=UPI0015F293D5|nr:2-amino-4-hydroxy-6-hydroxymethyldihydropteridine diphosphokinase [Alkalilimnicola ehrlichii]